MADLDNNLSLADALTEPPPEIEPEIKRDFIATLEAEKFDDVVGETVGKTDYVPLLDDDDDDDDAKAGSQDQKSKSHTEGVQVQRSSASGPAAVLENGDHGIGDYNTVSHEEIMDEKLSHKEFMDHKETWAMDERDLCFDPQAVFKPMEATEPGLMYGEVDLSDLMFPSETKTFPPLAEHVDASEEVHAPYAAMVGSEQPSSEAPYFAAEALDPSVFSMDSAAEYLQERAAPARDRVPEEPWFGSQYTEETPDASFFVQPTVPIRIPDAEEQCLPESPIADTPFLVAEPTKETKTTAAPQEAAPADPAADAGSVPAPAALAFAADSWAAPAVDAGTAPAMDPWSAGSAPAADLWSLPAANAASAPTMDSWAGPAADPWVTPAAPIIAADAGSSPAACVPTTEAGAVSAMEELLTFDHSIEQQGPALHMPPAGSSAPLVIREQEVPVPEVSVPEAEHAPVLAKLEDKTPSPNQHLPEPVTCVPEPAEAKEPVTIAEAKEPVTIAEAKETLPEKSAPLGDFTPVEKPREEPENGHVQHLEPVHDKPPQEPTAKPEEIKPLETVTGSDITAPPNKELPPSPEKKTKPSASTPSAKPAAEKAKPLSATSPKRPASTTPGQNKKSTSPTTGPAAATPKRPATGTPRPSTLTAKDTKPKVAEAKSTEKRTSLSKPASATTPRSSVKSSPAAPRTTAASPVTTTSSMKNTSASPPKRPTSIKTETKPADAKKTPVKSPSADLSRPRSAPGNSLKSSTTTSTATTPTTTMTSPGVATSRPKPKLAATRPATASSANADAKKPLAAKAPLKTSTTSKPSRPTSSVSAPDLKNVRSKIGSTDNIKHQPGGGKGKVEKKPESAGAARKPESNAVSKMATTKTTVTKESAQKQPNGKVQIVSKKANYSHVQSKCGSKDNIKHVPGGGNVQIQTKKVDLSKVSSKCGSKTNIKHKPGGGDIKVENQKLNFKEKLQAKVGSVDSAGQTPTEGPVKTEESQEAALPAVAALDGAAAVPQAGGNTQENGVGPAVPAAAGGGDQRDSQSFDTQIQETN